jgi:hypothetical protein
MDTNLDHYRAVIDSQMKSIEQNLTMFPRERDKAYFALLNVYQFAADLSEVPDLSRGAKLLLGHEFCERLSFSLREDEGTP